MNCIIHLKSWTFGLGLMMATSLAGAQQAAEYSSNSPAAASGQFGAAATSQVDVSDAKLKDFVEAHQEVSSISMDYSGKIQSTQDPSKAQSLQAEAQSKMLEAVEGAGLRVEEYNQIAQQLQQDPDLRKRVESMLGS